MADVPSAYLPPVEIALHRYETVLIGPGSNDLATMRQEPPFIGRPVSEYVMIRAIVAVVWMTRRDVEIRPVSLPVPRCILRGNLGRFVEILKHENVCVSTVRTEPPPQHILGQRV